MQGTARRSYKIHTTLHQMNYRPPRERKPIDAELRRYLDAIAPPAPEPFELNVSGAASASPPASTSSDEDRARARRALMLQAREKRGDIPGLPNGVRTRDANLSAEVNGRLYLPSGGSAPLPVLVYAHGGGWVIGSIETHDPFCRLLSEAVFTDGTGW